MKKKTLCSQYEMKRVHQQALHDYKLNLNKQFSTLVEGVIRNGCGSRGCGLRGCGLRGEGRGLWVEEVIKVTHVFRQFLSQFSTDFDDTIVWSDAFCRFLCQFWTDFFEIFAQDISKSCTNTGEHFAKLFSLFQKLDY